MQFRFQDGSVIICGALPKDAEYKTVGDKNSSLTKFGVKVGERPVGGQERPEAIWCNCTCWHAVARAAMGFKKGDVVLAIGKVQTRNYTDGNGVERTAKELVCEAVFVMATSEVEAPAPPTYVPPASGDFMNISVGDDDLPF